MTRKKLHREVLTNKQVTLLPLGRRAKWKDYVNLYFITKRSHGLAAITKRARHIFGPEFNEKLFRAQLAYFKDIDYSEKVAYLKGHEVSDRVIKETLKNLSVEE